jgi:serine/threonine protein kinase
MAGSRPRRFESGDRIAGKYVLRRHLATGGMGGEVWLARNESTGAEMAVKLLARGASELERELEIEKRFRNEARVTAGLSHRNIVKVFDLVEEPDGTLGLVMERLRGETLWSYLRRLGPRPPRDAVEVMISILSALTHVHDRGLVHRDVTPSNIFLAVDPDGHVTPKLVDFGIAKGISSAPNETVQSVQTVDGRVLGTPMYMPPERIRGSDGTDPRSDVFAAAVVLYEIMTGASPFAASTPAASLAAVLERHVDPDARIEPRFWMEIRRAMAKHPYERHATALEFRDGLRQALGDADRPLEASSMKDPPTGWDVKEADAPHPRGSSNPPVRAQRKVVSAAVWIAGAIVAAVAFGLVTLGVRTMEGRGRAAEGRSPGVASVAQGAAVASAPTPTRAITATAAPASSAPDSTNAPMPATRPRAPPKPSARPRPVATTPGF